MGRVLCHKSAVYLVFIGTGMPEMGLDERNQRLRLSVCHVVLGGALLATGVVRPVAALMPDRQLTQYAHNVWRTQDGALTGTPIAIAQTSDGYIWVGTRSGLLRFDGVRFVPWVAPEGKALPSKTITALLGGIDGSLWIGTKAGVARWKGGVLTIFPNAAGYIDAIIEDHGGAIWLARSRLTTAKTPLCLMTGSNARCFGSLEGVPLRNATALTEDGQGNLWVGDNTTLLRWRPGVSETNVLPDLDRSKRLSGIQALARGPEGALWVGLPSQGPHLGLRQFSHRNWKPFRTKTFDGSTLDVTTLAVVDDGTLFAGTETQGLYRIRGDKVDRFRAADGLSSDTVNVVFQDREGNLWVATGKGLDCFSNRAAISFAAQQGLTSDSVGSVFASADGGIWIGNWTGLDHLQNGVVTSIRAKQGLPGAQVTSLFEAHPGVLWLGIDNNLWTYEKKKFVRIARADGTDSRAVRSIVQDVDGSLWVATTGSEKQLLHIRDRRITEEITVPQGAPLVLTQNPKGGVYLGLAQNTVGEFHDGRFTSVALLSPATRGGVSSILLNEHGWLLAATNKGIFGIRNGKVQALSEKNGLPCSTTYNLVRDLNGTFWVSMECGLVKIPGKEMERWWERPEVMVQASLFNELDGIQTGLSPFQPGVSLSPDGRLWFANEAQLQMLDPAHLAHNSLLPPVQIEQIVADRKAYVPQEGLRLPALERDLEIDYTALSFVSPRRVFFRYKLEGHDVEWQEPGARRQAFYSDLPPGKYSFHVIASNNDGVWNETGATAVFSIAPAFYQTLWFKLCCLTAGAGGLWAFYAYRIQQATEQVQQRLGAKLEERERIARELHDTLLQGFQGVMLRFQAVMKILPEKEPPRLMMEKVMDRADGVLLEGRQSVRNLREQGSFGEELSQSLASYAAELSENYDAHFSLSVVGTPEALGPVIFGEICRIGREAMFNAFQHASAAKIEAELTYNRAGVRLVIRDDGTGIDRAVLENGRIGHWGLSGMRERAQKIGGQLTIWSSSGMGTEIDLMIPAKVAHLQKGKLLRRYIRLGTNQQGEI